MSKHTWLKGKKIGIWGFGKEGQASKRYLEAQGFAPQVVENDVLDGFDVLIKSPGISLYGDAAKKAIANGTTLTSCTNLWFEAHPTANTIVITGTKGKSTTTTLLHHTLKTMGVNVALGGNVGVPLLDVAPADLTLIELSSYQLADLQHAPTTFVVLNLFPEHLPWHGSHAQYYADKLRPLTLSPKPFTIAHKSLADRLNAECYFQSEASLPLPLKGQHNQENAAAVLAIIQHLGLNVDAAKVAFKTFKALPHRLEEVGEKDGVLYVNDSISTTPESALAALEAYKGRPVLLILGGEDRGQNHTQLAKATVKQFITLPDSGHRFTDETKKGQKAQNLEEAVTLAKAAATSGDLILLSPAAPSYNAFKNFEERGEKFKDFVRN